MSQSTEDYLDSLLRQAMGIKEPEPETTADVNAAMETEVIPEFESAQNEDLSSEAEDNDSNESKTVISEGTNFSSEKVSEFFADDAPFADDFVFPENTMSELGGVDIPEDMAMTDEGRAMLDEMSDTSFESNAFPNLSDVAAKEPSVTEVSAADEPIVDVPLVEEPIIEEPIIEEPIIEDASTEVPTLSIDDLDPNDANKALSPDMIAALFAGANAESDAASNTESTVESDGAGEAESEEPAEEENTEAVQEEAIPATMSIDDLDPNDANKALSEDMIAALFAGANAESDAGNDAGNDVEEDSEGEQTSEEDIDSDSLSGAMEVGGLDLGDVDLGAMLQEVTDGVESESQSDMQSDESFSASDLNDLLNSLDADDDLSDIGELLSKDENSEMVNPDSDIASLFGDLSEDGIDSFSDDSGNDDAEEDSKKKKKEKKKRKNKKSSKDDFDDFSGLENGGEEIILDPAMFDVAKDDGKKHSKKKESDKEKKQGFFAKLLNRLFEEVDEDEAAGGIQSDGNLIEETATEIALEGAQINEALLKEAEETGKNKKKKGKKDKKSKSGDGDSEDSPENDGKKKKKKKKEKVEEEPEVPSKKLPKKKVILIFVLCISIGAILSFFAIFYPYTQEVKLAKKYYATGEYEKTYEYLSGHKLKGDEEELYNKTFTILKLKRQYQSYINYMKMGFKMEALNALVQGVRVMDEYSGRAEELGVKSQFDRISEMITDELYNTFGISVDIARQWYMMDGAQDYTRALYDHLYNMQPRDENGNLIYIPGTIENEVVDAEENDL